MHDLKAVAILDLGGGESGFGHDLQVPLHRHFARIDAKVGQEGGHRQAGRELAAFAIDHNTHEASGNIVGG